MDWIIASAILLCTWTGVGTLAIVLSAYWDGQRTHGTDEEACDGDE